MKNCNKINWLLILQGWTMLWVVIGHAPLEDIHGPMPKYVKLLYDFAYSFHMPLFMLISGYLFYMTRLSREQWNYKSTMLEKLERLGIPFLVFTFIAMIVKTMFASDMARSSEISVIYFFNSCLYPALGPLNEMWFILTLIIMFLLFPLWKSILGNVKIELSTLAVLTVLHFIPNYIDFLCFSSFTKYLMWFFMGVLTSKYLLVNKLNRAKLGGVVLGIMLMGIGYYTIPEIKTLGIMVFSFVLAMAADKWIPSLFFSFRQYTYQIFLMGIFAQIMVKIIYKHINAPYLPFYVLCIMAGLYVPVIMSKVLLYINWKPLLLCVGLKKKK